MEQIVHSTDKPPVYGRLKAKFGVDWDRDGVIIAYDGKIHSKELPSAQKIVHEKKHLDEQKKLGNDVWWTCYFDSEEFRKEQEIMAYRSEAQFLKKYVKNRNDLYLMLREIADDLSSSVYGNMMSKSEAFKEINKS